MAQASRSVEQLTPIAAANLSFDRILNDVSALGAWTQPYINSLKQEIESRTVASGSELADFLTRSSGWPALGVSSVFICRS
jgi:hypothetical protein